MVAGVTPANRVQLFEGTALTHNEGLGRFERWQSGQDVQSHGLAIGSIAVSETERAAIRSFNFDYTSIPAEAIYGQPKRGIALARQRNL